MSLWATALPDKLGDVNVPCGDGTELIFAVGAVPTSCGKSAVRGEKDGG